MDYFKLCVKAIVDWEAAGRIDGKGPVFPGQRKTGLLCGALTVHGATCKSRLLYGNGRCKYHGGPLSGQVVLKHAGNRYIMIDGKAFTADVKHKESKPVAWDEDFFRQYVN